MYEHACDKNEDFLEFKPNIKAFIENEEIITAILKERQHQQEKWGDKHDDESSKYHLLDTIALYIDKARTEPETNCTDNYVHRLIQVAALATAAIEKMKRQQKQTMEVGNE